MNLSSSAADVVPPGKSKGVWGFCRSMMWVLKLWSHYDKEHFISEWTVGTEGLEPQVSHFKPLRLTSLGLSR